MVSRFYPDKSGNAFPSSSAISKDIFSRGVKSAARQLACKNQLLRRSQESGKKMSNSVPQRPLLSWPRVLREVRAWLEPWVMLKRYWRVWSTQSPPLALQQLLDVLGLGVPLFLTRVNKLPVSPFLSRHYYATDAIRNGTDIKSLQDAGGWNSPAMPLGYAESAKIANSGVKLSATNTNTRRKPNLDSAGNSSWDAWERALQS